MSLAWVLTSAGESGEDKTLDWVSGSHPRIHAQCQNDVNQKTWNLSLLSGLFKTEIDNNSHHLLRTHYVPKSISSALQKYIFCFSQQSYEV